MPDGGGGEPLRAVEHASSNSSPSGSTDLFCSLDGLLPVLILAPFVFFPAGKANDPRTYRPTNATHLTALCMTPIVLVFSIGGHWDAVALDGVR